MAKSIAQSVAEASAASSARECLNSDDSTPTERVLAKHLISLFNQVQELEQRVANAEAGKLPPDPRDDEILRLRAAGRFLYDQIKKPMKLELEEMDHLIVMGFAQGGIKPQNILELRGNKLVRASESDTI